MVELLIFNADTHLLTQLGARLFVLTGPSDCRALRKLIDAFRRQDSNVVKLLDEQRRNIRQRARSAFSSSAIEFDLYCGEKKILADAYVCDSSPTIYALADAPIQLGQQDLNVIEKRPGRFSARFAAFAVYVESSLSRGSAIAEQALGTQIVDWKALWPADGSAHRNRPCAYLVGHHGDPHPPGHPVDYGFPAITLAASGTYVSPSVESLLRYRHLRQVTMRT